MTLYDSTYERVERDRYETPEWVTEALLPHLGRGRMTIWEPCCGSGKMSRVLASCHRVISSDIELPANAVDTGRGWALPGAGEVFQRDFLADGPIPTCDAVVTNSPYGRSAPRFVRRALELMKPRAGLVAMLLPMNWDTAGGRRDLFADHAAFMRKIVLTRRIIWFEKGGGEAPKENHAWYIWDWAYRGAPTIAYAS